MNVEDNVATRTLIGEKLDDWKKSPMAGQPTWLAPNGTRADLPPDYPNDLNAVQTVIAKIRKAGQRDLNDYHKALVQICGSYEQAIDATAGERCNALLAAFDDLRIHPGNIDWDDLEE
jgi:hypothetical protein